MTDAKKDRTSLLRSVWLFERCNEDELNLLQRAASLLDLRAGRTLATQGELGREFVVIVEGSAEVTRDGTQIAVLGPGSFFGEMSLLDHEPRTATVTTLEPTCALVLNAAEFDTVVSSMPSVDRRMLIVLARRLREIEAKYVPVHDRISRSDVA